MKVLFTIVSLLVIQLMALAQDKPVSLAGNIIVNAEDTIPYKIVFTESNGVIKGYSLTYNEPYETRTKITGTVDRHNHILSFKETEIDYIHGYHSGPSLCLADASMFEIGGGNSAALMGSLSSAESDNTACGTAKLIFKDHGEIENLFAPHEKYDTVISMKGRIKETAKEVNTNSPIVAPLTTDKITAGEEKTYQWQSDTIVIDVWDGGDVDGDRITLTLNGTAYLSAYSLAKQKRQLHLPLSPGTNTIVIHADNEGSDPPNTASIMLTDGALKYSILAYNKKGDEAVIKIKKTYK